jgi:hypothetical protein
MEFSKVLFDTFKQRNEWTVEAYSLEAAVPVEAQI